MNEWSAWVWWLVCVAIGFMFIFVVAGCSCERTPTFGVNNISIRYVNYSDPAMMGPDCDWDAKNMSCRNHSLVGDVCYLNECAGVGPNNVRACSKK